VEDWRRFKQLEVEKREEESKEKALLAKRLALTCRSQVSTEPVCCSVNTVILYCHSLLLRSHSNFNTSPSFISWKNIR